MKKAFLSIFIVFLLSSCNVNIVNSEKEYTVSNTEETSKGNGESIMESEYKSENSTVVDNREYEDFLDISDCSIEIGEKYYIEEISKYPNMSIEIEDPNILVKDGNFIIGSNEGNSKITFELNNVYQVINFTVCKKGFVPNPELDIHRLYGKKLIALGDSVTANATINGEKVYADYFAKEFNNSFKNYAIGGTTLTYMYVGSNIYKEYSSNTTAIDGCRVAYKAYINNELNNVDYAIIAYGHNDQYFQPPISSKNDDNFDVNSFDSCSSFKGSFKYIIKLLREANPSCRIIVVNCTYSEYDKSYPSPYGSSYSYSDYIKAANEIADEMQCNCVELWDFTKKYFDNGKGNIYYKDFVHLTSKGHEVVGEYFIKQFKK